MILAGEVGPGYEDAKGIFARFEEPLGLAVDPNDRVYVADRRNHCIRAIDRDGTVTTLAGNGKAGFADGKGKAAQFYEPTGVAWDHKNFCLVVADTMNHRVRRVKLDGTVTTIAGDGQQGDPNEISIPEGVAVDVQGNVFVTTHHTIKKIDPAGRLSTFAGGDMGNADGPIASAKFAKPSGLAFDWDGNLYVADTLNSRIRIVTVDGQVKTLAGSQKGHKNGSSTAAQFEGPYGLAVDREGIVYVADGNNRTVRRVDRAGNVTTLAGKEPDNASRDTTLGYVYGLGRDSNDNLYVSNGNTPKIMKLFVRTAAAPGAQAQVSSVPGDIFARRLALDSKGNIYTVSGASTVQKLDTAGAVTVYAGTTAGYQDGPAASAKFGRLDGITIDKNDNMYLTDSQYHNVRKIDVAGAVTTFAGNNTAQPVTGITDGDRFAARFNTPRAIVAHADGNLYLNDSGNYCLRRIDAAGKVTTVSGSAGYFGGEGVAVAPGGRYFASETDMCEIKIVENEKISTFAGWQERTFADGKGTQARFRDPMDLASDRFGNLYVADTSNHRIRKIAPDGTVTTLAGTGFSGIRNGQGDLAKFSFPSGVAFGPDGALYVADNGNRAIRKIVLAR